MAILVTGGAGYIGCVTTHQLLAAGHKLIVVDNLSTGFRTDLPSEVAFEQADIGNSVAVANIISKYGIDGVVHFAASISVPLSLKDPLAYWQNNFLNTQKLVQVCLQKKVHQFIFSSTAAVYGETANNLVKETDELRPLNPYGSSKLLVERMLQDVAHSSNFKFIALRYFNVAGAQAELKSGQRTVGATNLVKAACEAATGKRDHLQIFGTDYPTKDGTCVRDFIHVEDVASAHIRALEYLRKGGESQSLNIGNGRGYSVREVVKAIENVSGKPLKVLESDRRAGDSMSVVADSSRAQTVLSWKPKYLEIEKMCGSALEWESRI